MKPAGNSIEIAVITGAHGVRGQVTILPKIDDPALIFKAKTITDISGKKQFRLTRQGVKEKTFIVAIEGVKDRNQAELLKGTVLYAPAPKPEKKADNEWYHRELIGLKAKLENGKLYGRVIACHNFGAGDILELQLENGNTEMLPFREPFVGAIHEKDGYFVVTPPEYLEARER